MGNKSLTTHQTAGEGRTSSGNAVGGIEAAWKKLDSFPFKLVSFLLKHPLLPPNSTAFLLLQSKKDSGRGLCHPSEASRPAGGRAIARLEHPRRPDAPARQAVSEAREGVGSTGSGCAAWRCAPPLRVTAADAGSICHELIPLSLRHVGESNGSAFPTY